MHRHHQKRDPLHLLACTRIRPSSHRPEPAEGVLCRLCTAHSLYASCLGRRLRHAIVGNIDGLGGTIAEALDELTAEMGIKPT